MTISKTFKSLGFGNLLPAKKPDGPVRNAGARSMFTEVIVPVVERNIGKYLRFGREVVRE